MTSEGIVVAGGGACLVLLGVVGLRRARGPLNLHPGISLIEAAASALDDKFEPLPEQRWERKFVRSLCWIGIALGVAFVLIGLNF